MSNRGNIRSGGAMLWLFQRITGVYLAVVLFAHIDTEAAGPGCTSPPTTAVIRDGRMYGLGTADSKAGVA